jgi:FkbM family methyltransferase
MNIFRTPANPGKQFRGETDIGFASTAKNVSPKEFASAVFRQRTIRTVVASNPFLRSAATNLQAVKNPFGMTFASLRGKEKIARFKDGSVLQVSSINSQAYEMEKYIRKNRLPISLVDGVATFKYNGRELSFELANSSCFTLKETFFLKSYEKLNFEGRVVLDIGANVGDTAVYFALGGAKRVIALEPYPQTYEVTVRNIERNRMTGTVALLNAGIGGKEAEVLVDLSFKSNGSSPLREFNAGKKVSIVTLDRLVEDYRLDGAVMKMDCEGGEYPAILGSKKLAAFEEIIMEYHYGYKNIKEKLEKEGFSVELIGTPAYNYNVHADHHHFILGMLHAKKKN